MGNAVLLDPYGGGTTVINDSDVATSDVADALMLTNPVIGAMVRWVAGTQPLQSDYMQGGGGWDGGDGGGGRVSRAGGLFERDRYVTPEKIMDQMRLAQAAVSDDIVDGFLESTESLAFSSVSMWSEDEDEQNIWNQIAADIDLDSRLREIWRELATVSQCYIAVWWGNKSYKVEGKTEKGNAKRKKFENLQVPLALGILDPLKVVPIGQMLFNRDQLAYVATPQEGEQFDVLLKDGKAAADDPIAAKLILGRHTPTKVEEIELQKAGVTDVRNLFLLNPAYVFRHTATRPGYRRFAELRMKSVFELLDMKHQLRQMERAHLIGAASFIVLIKKGTDQLPAKPAEILSLQGQVRSVARVPVIVGDHRLSVEIVTPKTDNTLRPERHNTLDGRLTARLYGMFVLGNYHAGGSSDDSVKLTRVVAAGMESRRHMIRRTLEKKLWQQVLDKNDALTSAPKLRFHPKRIALNFDNAWASFLMDIRDTGDLSRDTLLNEFDFSQDDEAVNRLREKESFDDIFQTQVPGAPANPALPAGPKPANDPTAPAQKRAGRRAGGRKNGGGAAPGSGQGQEPRKPRKLAADIEEDDDDGV